MRTLVQWISLIQKRSHHAGIASGSTGNRVQIAEKFDRFLIESYIEDNKMVFKWCTSTPHCVNAIRADFIDQN